MFGIMRPEGGCSNKNSSDYRFHRMHYCGVCKAMGNSYGHKSRLLLNYDSVFLSELLTELGTEDLNNWENAFQAINKCLTMPTGNIPVSLQYAADANVLLADLKIQDQLLDNGSLGWRFAQKFFNKPFVRNAAKLSNWGIDKNEIQKIGEFQLNIEKNYVKFDKLEDCIEFYAKPTAELTALIFGNAAQVIARPELKEKLSALGYDFGQMAYLLDAFEDFEKDIRKGQFNPLAKFFNSSDELTELEKDEIRTLIGQNLNNCSVFLLELIPERADIYYSRLRSNVMLQLFKESKPTPGFRERLAMRWQYARDFAAEMTCDSKKNLASKLRYQMLSLAVFVAPKTPEYMGVARDSSIFSWSAFLAAFLVAIGLGVVVGRRKKKRQHRKSTKKLKNFMKAISSGYFLKRGCWEEILSLCCAACACGCCEICCESGCNSCCSKTCEDSRSRRWIWIFLAFLLVVAGITALLFFLL
jgi:hypothetical protein